MPFDTIGQIRRLPLTKAMDMRSMLSKKKFKKCSASRIYYYKLKTLLLVEHNTVTNKNRCEAYSTVVIMRHGQSVWNAQDLFTGWEDADLTQTGKEEAINAGKLLRKQNINFNLAHCSLLKRAIKTLWITLDTLDQVWIPIKKHWRLNARHYGHLTGLNKIKMEQTYGSDTVKKWRKSYDYLPKPIGDNNKNWKGLDDRYKDVSPNLIPQNESLKDTVERVKLYWNTQIQTDIEKGKNIIISAHGNSIRALLMYLENINAKDIEEINIPRAIPIIIKFDQDNNLLSKTFLR